MKNQLFVLFLFVIGSLISCVHTPREPAAAKANVLYIGDSISLTRLGTFTDKAIRNEGYNLSTYISCGSKPSSWSGSAYTSKCGYWVHAGARDEFREWSRENPPLFRTPNIENLINEHRPAVVIIQLGNNMLDNYQDLSVSAADNYVATQVKKLLDLAVNPNSGARVQKCIWVSPPDTTKYPSSHEDALDNILKKVSTSYGCSFIRSKDYTTYVKDSAGEDGEHYYGKNKSAQMEKLGKKIVETLKATGL